jgi:hypothetical protein
MELFFLLIFILFILLNVVIGLVSSRAKKRKAALHEQTEEYPQGAPPEAGRRAQPDEAPEQKGMRGGYALLLQEQTSETLVRSMYEEAAQRERELDEALEAMEKTRASYAKPPTVSEPTAAIEVARAAPPARAGMDEATSALQETGERKTSYPTLMPRRLDERRPLIEEDRVPAPEPPEARREEGDVVSFQPGSGWERLERLPPLQRAVILSEILGPPRGLSDRTHSH